MTGAGAGRTQQKQTGLRRSVAENILLENKPLLRPVGTEGRFPAGNGDTQGSHNKRNSTRGPK